jgi:predicted Zn-dependent peptidase
MKPQIYTLTNGLTILFVDTQAFPTLTTMLMVGAGSRYENKINNGIAHFFEHMAFKGSKKYPNAFIISSTIEGLGGVFNAFTSKDHTGYWIKATSNHFEQVVDVISDMVLHSLLLPEEINKEKGVIVEEINMYEDMPQRKVGEMFENLMYDSSPLGYDIAGHRETVTKFTNKTFIDYMNQLYHPNNALMVVAGGLNNVGNGHDRSVQNFLEIIKNKFSRWKKGEKSEFETVVNNQTKPKILVKYKETEQAHFCLGFPAFSFLDKRKYTLALLTTILGGGMSSRLFMEVREKRGLCYYISTGREHYSDTGNIVTQAGVTKNIDKVKEAIGLILKEHDKVTKGEVKKSELEKAREMVKGRLLLSLEDSFSVSYFFGIKKLLENKIETPEDVIVQINQVTMDDIVSLAKELFKHDQLNLAVIGPFKKKEEFEKAIE